MNDIYLIRHTTPAVAKGVCYGQTDLDITESFLEEAEVIRQVLPDGIRVVHSSPLQRCARLARHLFPGHSVSLEDELMEVYCGQWEMKTWDELPKEEIDPWMADFVNIRIPGGESYLDLQERVHRCWERIRAGAAEAEEGQISAGGAIAVVSHGGVIRSLLSGITGTPLIDSFKVFGLHYGCVIRVFEEEGGRLGHEILSNRVPAEKEQHKPSSFYKK
ncbi:MAG TPA: alpha-ribazole phosphatase family protein [Puia sp.]|jgi:alpha-ribazole phosphatase